jgi:hypothetical protein
MRGLPFYGQKGDFNFVTGKSQFTPGVSIKLLPLKDLSLVGSERKPTDFERYINHVKKFFKPGDRVRGTEINSQFESNDDDGTLVVGNFERFEIDYDNKRVRTFLKNRETMETFEVYPETMERVFESEMSFPESGATLKYVKTYEEFGI